MALTQALRDAEDERLRLRAALEQEEQCAPLCASNLHVSSALIALLWAGSLG